jgi:hypothetical protein
VRPAAIALAAALAAAPAAADPIVVRYANPVVTLTVPHRFERVEPDRAHPDLLDVFRRAGELPGEAPMVLQLVRLDALVPQRTLLPAERAALRRADPFDFTDRVEHDRTLGFAVETLVGSASFAEGITLVRFATAVPLDDDAVLVVLVAPGHRARDARALHRAVLASVRAPTTWETAARRRFNAAMRFALLATLLASVVYAVAARARPRARPRAALAVATLWAAVAAWLCAPWREHEWPFAVFALIAALAFALLAWRARPATSSSSAPDPGR